MNFGLRLDEIVDDLVEGCEDGSNPLGYRYDLGSKAKQAITSLMKELVAEAKPDKLKESDYTLNMRVPHNPPSNTTRTNLYRKGYNDSLDQFEQNLLKALEEKK